MNAIANDAHDAGRLLAFALAHRSPATSKEYAELLRRYDEEVTLRTITDGVCDGLGLRVIHVGKHGLIVTAIETSPFRLSADDYRSAMSPEERICHGIIQVAIAAWSFPRAETLAQDDDVQAARITAKELAKWLRDFAEAENTRHSENPDPSESEEKRTWRLVLAQAVTKETKNKRESPKSLTGMCAYALDYLAAHGLLRAVDENNGVYQGTSAYRIRLKYHGAHALLEQLRSFALKRSANQEDHLNQRTLDSGQPASARA
jgi:hypothetical protein